MTWTGGSRRSHWSAPVCTRAAVGSGATSRLDIAPGEFIAVLGPNGAGKTSLLRVLLGLTPLSAGTVTVGGVPPHRGSHLVGYIPQQKGFDADLGARGRDLVRLGADGHRFGLPWPNRAVRDRVDAAIASVGAQRPTRTRRSGGCPAVSNSACGSPKRCSDEPTRPACAMNPCCRSTSTISRVWSS